MWQVVRGYGRLVQTLGVDVAAGHKKTMVARMSWTPERASLVELHREADNETILGLISDPLVEKVGIDCPLGWPVGFIEFVVAHRDHRLAPGVAEEGEARLQLAYRRTDLAVRRLPRGLNPLSVSTDRIGRAAMRVAGLLAALEDRGVPIDRAGAGRIVEVYPAAALKQWGLPFRSYKGAGTGLPALAGEFFDRTAEWLEITADDRLWCERSDDVFDAVVAAVIARAATLPEAVTTPDSQEDWHAARTEGWIAVPRIPLEALDPRTT